MDDGEPQLPVLIRVKDFYRKESHLNIKRSTSLAVSQVGADELLTSFD